MSTFDPKKLSVSFICGTSSKEPIAPRKYTLTHSDATGELFLTIAPIYDYEKITDTRDEVLGEWILVDGKYIFNVYLHVDGDYSFSSSSIRNSIFREELPLAIKALRYGDRMFFNKYDELNYSPIVVHFNSIYPNFNKVEIWGNFSTYLS